MTTFCDCFAEVKKVKRRIFVVLSAFLLGLMATTGCYKRDIAAEEAAIQMEKLTQGTAQHKINAYNRFMEKGGSITAFAAPGSNGEVFDLAEFLKVLGLDYWIYDDTIVIRPNLPYTPDEDFEYTLEYSEDIVRGHILQMGKYDDSWTFYEHYDSATDVIYQMLIGKQLFLIGADEFEQMYSKLRILTTPSEHIEEVNWAIGEEWKLSDVAPDE